MPEQRLKRTREAYKTKREELINKMQEAKWIPISPELEKFLLEEESIELDKSSSRSKPGSRNTD